MSSEIDASVDYSTKDYASVSLFGPGVGAITDEDLSQAVQDLMQRKRAGSPIPGSTEEETHKDGKRVACNFPRCDCSMGAAERCLHPAVSAAFDPRTGRPYGDHGTAIEAIQFAAESGKVPMEEAAFLKNWMEGNLDQFPEYYSWLKDREAMHGEKK